MFCSQIPKRCFWLFLCDHCILVSIIIYPEIAHTLEGVSLKPQNEQFSDVLKLNKRPKSHFLFHLKIHLGIRIKTQM